MYCGGRLTRPFDLLWRYSRVRARPSSTQTISSYSHKYPKITPEKFGIPECVLVRRLYNSHTERWDSFSQLDMRDQELRKRLSADGLEVGEWITIPDPFEKEWPFERRHPGKRCPPDPLVEAMEIVNDSDDDLETMMSRGDGNRIYT